MKQGLFECAFCGSIATGYGIGAMILTVLMVMAILA